VTSGLAYLFPAFPVFHQTFVLWEILGLHRNGLRPKIYSLRSATEKQQPEGEQIRGEVTYLPRLGSKAVLAANWRLLIARPLRYLGAYWTVIQAWRTGAFAPPIPGWESRPLKLHERLRGWFNRQPLLYLLKSLSLVPQAIELAERLAADGIRHLHVHWATYPATMALVVRYVSGLPFSISAHAYDIYMISRMLPAKLDAAEFVVTCAKTNAAYLTQLAGADLGKKVQVNYHGVNVERFSPRPDDAAGGNRLLVVSCGQLERYKGMHLLVEACARLRSEGIPVECRIVGEGPRRSQLEEQIAKLGLKEHVVLLGAQPHAQVARLFREADVFALASELGGKSGRRDVIANVVVEAMAAGLPVIASRIPGAEELVEDEVTGFLVLPNRVDEIVVAIRRLAADAGERRRIGAAARARVLADFDSSKNVRSLAALLAAAAGADSHSSKVGL